MQKILCLVCVFLTGCATMNVERSVNTSSNTFTSSKWPEIKIRIDPSLVYIGSVEDKFNIKGEEGTRANADRKEFLFATGGKRMDKFLSISFYELPYGNWTTLFNDSPYMFNTKSFNFEGEIYKSVNLVSQAKFHEKIFEKMLDRGLLEDPCYISRGLAKKFREGRIKVYIIYGQSLSGSGTKKYDWENVNVLTQNQSNALDKLETGFLEDVVFLPGE